jgi:hypothetical protein
MAAKRLVQLHHEPGGTLLIRGPSCCTATERTCSACALESWRRPVARAGSSTWTGYTCEIRVKSATHSG